MTKKETYLVEGMSCASCKIAIEQALKKLSGIETVNVDLPEAALTFEYDPSRSSLDMIRSTLSSLGYRLSDLRPPANRESHDPVG